MSLRRYELGGNELEEPKEPLREDCRVRVLKGALLIDVILDEVRRSIYEYNSMIRDTGYYLKPVHKVYKTLSNGARRVYEYYGLYWWRLMRKKGGVKYYYVGKRKPRELPDPPNIPIEGLSFIREGEDIIVDCRLYDKYKTIFKNLAVERA